MATIRIKDGDASQFIRVITFSESPMAELLRLGDGDVICAQGVLKVEVYEKAGEHRASMTIIADAVLALRPAPKERKPKPAEPARDPDPRSKAERQRGTWSGPGDGPSDDLPW